MITSSRTLRFANASRFRRATLRAVMATVLALLSVTAAQAGEYVAYPGIYPVRVMAVESASRIVVEVPVWTGFTRVFTVTIPGVAVPRDFSGAPQCERDLAIRAKKFTESFLAHPAKVQVRDIRMQDSADEDAVAAMQTDAGSLADALRKQGFARPIGESAATPWCKAK